MTINEIINEITNEIINEIINDKTQTSTQTSAPPQTTLTIPAIINSFTNEIINEIINDKMNDKSKSTDGRFTLCQNLSTPATEGSHFVKICQIHRLKIHRLSKTSISDVLSVFVHWSHE